MTIIIDEPASAVKCIQDEEEFTRMMIKPTAVVATPIDVPFAIAPPPPVACAPQKIATPVGVVARAREDQ